MGQLKIPLLDSLYKNRVDANAEPVHVRGWGDEPNTLDEPVPYRALVKNISHIMIRNSGPRPGYSPLQILSVDHRLSNFQHEKLRMR